MRANARQNQQNKLYAQRGPRSAGAHLRAKAELNLRCGQQETISPLIATYQVHSGDFDLIGLVSAMILFFAGITLLYVDHVELF